MQLVIRPQSNMRRQREKAPAQIEFNKQIAYCSPNIHAKCREGAKTQKQT